MFKIMRVLLFLILLFSLFFHIKKDFAVKNKIYETIKIDHKPYKPKYLKTYIQILENHYDINLKQLEDIKFYTLHPLKLELACDYYQKDGYLLGCFSPLHNVIYINLWEFGSCVTELHELAHVAIELKQQYGPLTNLMSSLHMDVFLREDKNNFNRSMVDVECEKIKEI